jgi:hypothetical protein
MSDLPNSPGGYFTNGMATPTGADLSANSRIPVDTGLSNGQSPQAGGIIPGTLIAASAQLGLTAAADGLKADATALGYGANSVTTVAGANDSVLLPYAFPGAVVFVENNVATAMQVFGKGTDTCDGVATGTGVVQGASKRVWYIGLAGSGDGSDAGAWVSLAGVATT